LFVVGSWLLFFSPHSFLFGLPVAPMTHTIQINQQPQENFPLPMLSKKERENLVGKENKKK
jgi:hypothetical protein